MPGPLGRGADRPLVQAVQVSGLISLAEAGEGGNSGMKLGQMVLCKLVKINTKHYIEIMTREYTIKKGRPLTSLNEIHYVHT